MMMVKYLREAKELASVQFSSVAVVSDSLWPHESQHARPPCPSPTPGVYSNSYPLSRWCHPTISCSVVPFSSCLQSLPASGSFPMSQLFAWGGQSIGVSASASVLPMNTQNWSPLGWIGWNLHRATQPESDWAQIWTKVFCLWNSRLIGIDSRSIPNIRYWFWRRKWQPIPVFLPGEPMDRGAWQVTVHGITMSWTQLKWLRTHAHHINWRTQVKLKWSILQYCILFNIYNFILH